MDCSGTNVQTVEPFSSELSINSTKAKHVILATLHVAMITYMYVSYIDQVKLSSVNMLFLAASLLVIHVLFIFAVQIKLCEAVVFILSFVCFRPQVNMLDLRKTPPSSRGSLFTNFEDVQVR